MKMQLYHKMLEVEDNDAMTYIQCHEPNVTKYEQISFPHTLKQWLSFIYFYVYKT